MARAIRSFYKKGDATRWFVAGLYYNGHINLGFSLDFRSPNIEIHFPFGFLRVGWCNLQAPGLRKIEYSTRTWRSLNEAA
jgi:hypothetical protein